MTSALILIFILCYAAIALEEPLKVNKSASALIGAGLLWTVYAVSAGNVPEISAELAESVTGIAQIAFFLMGAMIIVEVIDAHDGFSVITSRIRAKSYVSLIWSISVITFFLSSVLDNLTTAIVMVSLARKVLGETEDRLIMAGLIVIAANAGGAWSPIGDVTTTMLWIGGQVTTGALIPALFLPSVVNLLVPLLVLSFQMRGKAIIPPSTKADDNGPDISSTERTLMFGLGFAILLAVPLFKMITHLPPFLGILFGLGLFWTVGDILHKNKAAEVRHKMMFTRALARIDMSAILFFVGILLAVATLEHSHILSSLAQGLDKAIGSQEIIVIIIGLASAIVDNVPIVAAAMGMYDLSAYPADSSLWLFLAYCAGTGGSILIIGSAAGVAAMGIQKIEFLWYLRKFSLIALLGYLAGALTYLGQYALIH
jgi:Na+/H+ antiporter NhaD/arsenite permease-like protein